MTFKWLRPIGKWLLRTIVDELLDELARRREDALRTGAPRAPRGSTTPAPAPREPERRWPTS